MAVIKMNKSSSRRTWFRRIAWALCLFAVVLIVLTCAASWYIDWACCAVPPAVNIKQPLPAPQVHQTDDGYRHLGNCYLGKKDGILRMRLTGDSFSLGYYNAVLTGQLIQQQEMSLLDTVRSHVPSRINLWLLTKYVLLRNRNLPSFIPLEYQVEIYGMSVGYEDPFPGVYPLYHRLLNYHAAHDISHAVMDTPLVGCTSFAAWGSATNNGHLLLARNFDFNAGRCFDENKVVVYFKPDQGLGFISVAWPGMVGVVSGINEARIAVTVNAASSADSRTIGTPVSLLIRDVMQHSSTLDQAVKTIEQSNVFVSDSYLVADGKCGRAVVVEKTPRRSSVRPPSDGDEDFIICSNHFLSDELRNDQKNLRYMAEGTSVERYNRTEGLVRSHYGALTPQVSCEILRDRKLPQSDILGLGNDVQINPFIATHSVIIDVTDGIIWVSSSPHQLGRFIPFSLSDFEQAIGAEQIPPDPVLASGEYDRYLQAADLLSKAQSLLSKGSADEAAGLLRQAEQLNPVSYLPPFLLGKIAFDGNKWEQARTFLSKAQALYPPFGSQRCEISRMLNHIDKEQAKRKN